MTADASDSAPPTVRTDAGATVVDLATTDVPCRSCGFNLRGLAPDGRCPECGAPVGRSIRGDHLIYSDPSYLDSLRLGIVCILISAIIQCALILTGITVGVLFVLGLASDWFTMTNTPAWVAVGPDYLMIPFVMLALYGWWRFSAPDPAVQSGDRGDRPRRIVRVTTVILVVATFLNVSIKSLAFSNPAMEPYSAGLETIHGLTFITQFFASLLYIMWLAPRIPSPKMRETAKRYLWLLPLLFIPGCVVLFLGPIVAIVMYFLLLNRVRTALRTTRAQQDEEGAEVGLT
ncbi:MAG: hypothetical protein KJO43_04205 [Phycisphaerae bacterium]|nr:hypothetical protein [Phycisphaerae bacterium]